MRDSAPTAFDGRVPPPRFANLETTLFCNLKCPMCLQFQAGTTVTGPHMAPEVFDRAARELFPFVHEIELSTAGEPLMSKNLDRVLAEAARWGVRARYYTNGTLLDDRMLRRILPTLSRLDVSFDGATKETFEAIRAGADFERVVANVRHVTRAARALPPGRRPRIGLAVTLMERNVDELPALVDLAAQLGVDGVAAAHVYAASDAMRRDSLVHHGTRARRAIEDALARAAAQGLDLHVAPLDGKEQALARSESRASITDVPESESAGVVAPDGLEERSHEVGGDRPRGGVGPEHWTEEVRRRRRGASRGASFFDPPQQTAHRSTDDEPIWVCDYLWNKIYVTVGGKVIPCCVPGRPEVGDLRTQTLREIWDGPAYRAMRHALARREPVSACRGCQHIREVRSPGEKARWLHGRDRPTEPTIRALGGLPEALRPYRLGAAAARHGASASRPGPEVGPSLAEREPRPLGDPAVLDWPPASEASRYEVQLSLDAFRTIAFSTDWHAIALCEPRFPIPDWLLAQIPRARPVRWRAIAVLPLEKLEVAAGTIVRGTARTMRRGRVLRGREGDRPRRGRRARATGRRSRGRVGQGKTIASERSATPDRSSS